MKYLDIWNSKMQKKPTDGCYISISNNYSIEWITLSLPLKTMLKGVSKKVQSSFKREGQSGNIFRFKNYFKLILLWTHTYL